MLLFTAIFLSVFISDRITKILIFENFAPGMSHPVVNGIFHITHVRNRGIAFGLFENTGNIFFIWLAIFALIAMLYFLLVRKPKPVLLLAGVSLVFSGAAGNLADRILYGYVLDFIDLRIWPVFNIADSAITIGAGLIVVYMFRQNREGKRKKAKGKIKEKGKRKN